MFNPFNGKISYPPSGGRGQGAVASEQIALN